MSLFGGHTHIWAEVTRTYAQPVQLSNVKNANPETFERLVMGVTTILWKCTLTTCDAMIKQELLGQIKP